MHVQPPKRLVPEEPVIHKFGSKMVPMRCYVHGLLITNSVQVLFASMD